MTKLSGGEIRIALISSANNLRNNKDKINDLNVFPVPDGDTGTNMGMTFGAAVNAAAELGEDAGASEIFDVLAKSSLRNARGNSGVILSQILRGAAKGLGGCADVGVEDIKNAARLARDTAYRAVMKPTEGTILTVVREIAECAEERYKEFESAADFLKELTVAAERSLEGTTELLPKLKEAGVVDAGGCGVVTILRGAVYAIENGEPIASSETEETTAARGAGAQAQDIRYRYCTEFLINKEDDRQPNQFTAAIKPKGDCMLVIDDEDIVKVHIHTNHPGFVIEQALKLGELTNIKIDNMKYQHNELTKLMKEDGSEKASEEEKNNDRPAAYDRPGKKYGFAVVASGEGFREIFISIGADSVVEGGQTMNPSAQELVDAAERIDAENIFILPNNKNIVMAAEQVGELTDKNIYVIPTVDIPQGISAMLGFDESESLEDNLANMKEMSQSVKCGQVTTAVKDVAIGGATVKTGDIIGVVDGGVEAVGDDIDNVCLELFDKLTDDESGVLSIYYGRGVDKSAAEELKEKVSRKFPDLDATLNYGGQAVYDYILAVE
ncbi:MAG TPA: DAK2 domain-containing protein [Firmicutes bacterium]|nr:DAK2 domain-containing protein [Bacillota bacterium]